MNTQYGTVRRNKPNPHTQAGHRWHVVRTMLEMDFPGKSLFGRWHINEDVAASRGMTFMYSPSGKVVNRVATGSGPSSKPSLSKESENVANDLKPISRQQRNAMTRSAMKTMSAITSRRLFSMHCQGSFDITNGPSPDSERVDISVDSVEDPGLVWIRAMPCPVCHTFLDPDGPIVHIRWGTHVYCTHTTCSLKCIL